VLHELQFQPHPPSWGEDVWVELGHWGTPYPTGDPVGGGLDISTSDHFELPPTKPNEEA
jgi:hypothetical protein